MIQNCDVTQVCTCACRPCTLQGINMTNITMGIILEASYISNLTMTHRFQK